jgi:hypothetical protein
MTTISDIEVAQAREAQQNRVRAVSKMSKDALKAAVRRDAAARGRSWVLGGPEWWSRDELVRYVLHEIEETR